MKINDFYLDLCASLSVDDWNGCFFAVFGYLKR